MSAAAAPVSRFLAKKLRLKVNEAKSAVARPEERKFLGFSISNDGSERRIAPKALDKFKTQVRDKTRRTLCCTDQQPGAVSPPQRHLWEANVLRPPEFEHAVQRGDGNGHLGHLPAFGP